MDSIAMNYLSKITIEKHEEEKFKEFEAQIPSIIERLYRTALIMTRNPREAEKLIQDTFSNAWQEYQRHEATINFNLWLSRTLLSTFIDDHEGKIRVDLI
ncbi:MAG: RNA polymerase sigma factor [bacterium]